MKKLFLMSVLFIGVICYSYEFVNAKDERGKTVKPTLVDTGIYSSITDNNSISNVSFKFTSPVKMDNDSIYFTYQIKNETNKNYVIYNFHNLKTLIKTESESDYPMCNLYIFDENNKLPPIEYVSTLRRRSVSPDKSKQYVELPAGSTRNFIRSFNIEGIVLKGGTFKFKLKYLPPRNNFYNTFKERLKEEKGNNPTLKDFILFDEILETDLVQIEVIQ